MTRLFESDAKELFRKKNLVDLNLQYLSLENENVRIIIKISVDDSWMIKKLTLHA